MPIQRPTHPVAVDSQTNGHFGLLSEFAELIMPATKAVNPNDIQDREINRPLADDYQTPNTGPTAGGGLDLTTPTRDYFPDVDRTDPVDFEPPRPWTPNIVGGPPVPVTIVPQVADTYTVSQFRTVFGAQAFYVGPVGVLDVTTVTQIVPFDLARTKCRIIVTGNPIAAGAALNYVFAISNNRDGTDYIALTALNQTIDLNTTGEVWAGIIPVTAYGAASINTLTLGIQLDSIYTGVSSS